MYLMDNCLVNYVTEFAMMGNIFWYVFEFIYNLNERRSITIQVPYVAILGLQLDWKKNKTWQYLGKFNIVVDGSEQ